MHDAIFAYQARDAAGISWSYVYSQFHIYDPFPACDIENQDKNQIFQI